MTAYYYLHPSYVYYLDPTEPDGLRVVEGPGRCSIFHAYQRAGAYEQARYHIEICDDCRDWLDRCEEIVMKTVLPGESHGEIQTYPARTERPDPARPGLQRRSFQPAR